MYELLIIGAGPAGMTAAVYAARKKINTLLVAGNVGGQVITTTTIENYMGYQFVEGSELMKKFEDQTSIFSIERNIGEEAEIVVLLENGFEIKTGSGSSFQAKAVIIATGKMPRRLNVTGEDRLIGRGVSYCSVCDGPLFSGEKVVVVGGGNSAFEAISDMLKIADHVYAVAEAKCTCDAVLLDRVKDNPKLSLLENHIVQEIYGADRVEGVIIQDVMTKEQKKLEVGGVFVEIGLIPNSNLVKGLASLNSRGEIEVNCNCETSVPGLYAAGDVASTPEKQIIIAAGDGAKASLQAHRFLQRL